MRKLLILLVLLPLTGHLRAQGCSDAGFCTMGAMKPDQPFNKKLELKLRSVELSFYRGTTSLTPVISVATADLNFSLTSRTFFQVKVPWQSVRGNFGNTSGLSDISLCFTRNVFSDEKGDINLSFGAKLPANKSDLASDKPEFKNLPLPMYYQTSLGTYDLIAGISYITPRWLFATGIQHPLNANHNQFKWGPWLDPYPDDNYVREYAAAVNLRRGTDVMLRIERNFRFTRFNFSAGALPIYRLNYDQITNAEGKRVKVSQARGLALSAIVTAGYQFNVRSGVKALFGHKLVQRQANPDGLSREMVTTLSYYYRF